MNTQHTPGPWEVSNRGDSADFDGKCRVIIGDNMRVAIVFADGNAQMQAENKANARLIAAAPDLLDALRECGKVASRFYQINGDIKALNAFMRADKAIAKAEGQEEQE